MPGHVPLTRPRVSADRDGGLTLTRRRVRRTGEGPIPRYPTAVSGKSTNKSIHAPKGTRDLYPEDALRRRYVQQAWRDASIRCGFDEIAGPTFETSELYAVKSGEGILNELFQAYSGKSPEEVEQVKETGRAPYAMRPEFTPTLARMYAAKAGSLPKPCKWFTAGPYFRAERPQRGRLREFEQWNVDVIGLPREPHNAGKWLAYELEQTAEVVEVAIQSLVELGLVSSDIKVHVNNRLFVESVLQDIGVPPERVVAVIELLDRRQKMSSDSFAAAAFEVGLSVDSITSLDAAFAELRQRTDGQEALAKAALRAKGVVLGKGEASELMQKTSVLLKSSELLAFCGQVDAIGYGDWLRVDPAVIRGLAYYTGTVFEVIAEGERAVAGGGRYDNLIELMGGPPTPAVGFAMGDVVLSLLLDDKGLMPEGADLLDAVSRPCASVRPDVFVIGADDEATDPLVRRLAADLRRGVESKHWSESDDRKPWARERYESATGGVSPLHARVSYKSTRNLKKLLSDGEKQFARYAAIVHGEDRVQLRDLDSRSELTPKDVPGMDDGIAEFSVDPTHPAYVGRAVAGRIA